MKKWTFENWHFIEVDGQIYILKDDVLRDIEKTIAILETTKKQ